MSPTWVTFLFEAANFLLLAGVLGWLFFKPVRLALERRRAALEREQSEATELRRKLEAELEEARAKRASFERTLESLRERVEREAEAERSTLLEAARSQVERERERVADDLVARRRGEAQSLARDAAAAAREIVVRLLREVGGPELDAALLGAACRELESLRASGALAPVVVEAPAPLDEGALAALSKAAGASGAEVATRVTSDLIAGLRVLTARGLVDLSASGLALQAERALVEKLDHGRPSLD